MGTATSIVGAHNYDNGQTMKGRPFYHGSATGVNTTAASMTESNQAGSDFGYSVAGAGDVNGDGYGDVIVGDQAYSMAKLSKAPLLSIMVLPQGSVPPLPPCWKLTRHFHGWAIP
jgi:hypothetical protein